MTPKTVHIPVLLSETLDRLIGTDQGLYVDATLGGGGHTEALLQRGTRVMAIDRDPEALQRAEIRLAPWLEESGRLTLIRGDFANMKALVEQHGVEQVDGVLMDLGISSDQLATGARGFSFQADGPLDMRMDPDLGLPASEWLHTTSEVDMAETFFRLGEERQSRRIAKNLVAARDEAPILTTSRLAELVERAVGGRKGRRIHPATKVFQAIRMAVNRELEVLQEGLAGALAMLRPGGRLAVITFHSLEDRAVKRYFMDHVGRDVSLPEGGSRWEGSEPRARFIQRKALGPSDEECRANPRSRSAKLRVIERLDDTADS